MRVTIIMPCGAAQCDVTPLADVTNALAAVHPRALNEKTPGQHRSDLDDRSLSRALEHLPLRERRQARVLRIERRLDAAQLVSRIEITYPIRSEALTKRIDAQILGIALADNVKTYVRSDGKYERHKTEGAVLRSQEACIAIARAEAVRLGPYEEIIRKPGPFRRKAKKKKQGK